MIEMNFYFFLEYFRSIHFFILIINFIRVSKIGNLNLKPQSSTNSNFGLIYLHEDRKISIDYWQIDYEDRLTVESATAIYEANPNNPIFTYNGSTLYAANIKYINEYFTI